MSRLQPSNHHSALLSTSGTWGEADVVASSRGVTLSLTSKNYDTLGFPHVGSALANLSVPAARRLAGLLHEAVALAEEAAPVPGLWSDAKTADIARRVSRVQ